MARIDASRPEYSPTPRLTPTSPALRRVRVGYKSGREEMYVCAEVTLRKVPGEALTQLTLTGLVDRTELLFIDLSQVESVVVVA